jgi:predicted methyltransferase
VEVRSVKRWGLFVAILGMTGIGVGVALAKDDIPPRTPAPVMTFEGADWLERPERDKEERPDEVIKAMGLKDGDVVVDMGCGTGYFARRMAKAVAPKGKVYGVDIQPEMLDMMKELCKKEGITNVEPVLGEEADPKLPKGAADWMILVDVYHEFQNPQPMLAQMREALKETGKICLVEYRAEGDTAQHIKAEHRMSVKQVLAEWNRAGFELVDLQEFLPSQHLFIFGKDPDRK